MARRLILDATTLIAYERGRFDTTTLDGDDLAIAAVTVAEYRTGVELADTAERAAERARLLAQVRRTGTPRRAHDLIIAAHAAQEDRAVMSLDARARFGDLPGVRAESPS